MSVLDRQAIPKSFLSTDIEEVKIEKALGTLEALTLVPPEQGHQAFTLHRLAHLATPNWFNMNEELDFWKGKTLI